MAKTYTAKNKLTTEETKAILETLAVRFGKFSGRHEGIDWEQVKARLESNAGKLWTIAEMERSGGEPDVVAYDKKTGEYTFFDCSPESPAGRRSFCYDRKALDSRKENKPKGNAEETAALMGIELLDEEQYRQLQQLGQFDTKTSSWIRTPEAIRSLGGALFGDYRYGQVFIYHNGAESYYAARAFRGSVKV